jgi:hypothetical protein
MTRGNPVAKLGRLESRPVRRWMLLFMAVSVTVTGCSLTTRSGDAPSSPEPSASAATSATAASSATAGPAGPASDLLVLADGVQGSAGLWIYDESTGWTAVAPLAGATALGRDGDDLTLALGGSLEVRKVSSSGQAGTRLQVSWPAQESAGSVVAASRSPTGRTAIVRVDANEPTFFVVSADGSVSLLSPAPASAFSPLVAWIDADRLVALSTDAEQISRLAVIDTAGHSLSTLHALGGVRVFAVSPDRGSLAAATESAVYVAPVSDWIGGAAPAKGLTLGSSEIVWDLALDAGGSHLAMFSGTESEDGNVTDVHEIGYARTGSSWQKIFDAPVPFTHASGQVWLG